MTCTRSPSATTGALDAKPGKGPITEKGIAAITDSVADVPDLLAEVERLSRWKAEALPVMDGLQDLGKALGLPLGGRITGPAALEAVERLREREQVIITNGSLMLDAAEATIARVEDLAELVEHRMMATATPSEIRAALEGNYTDGIHPTGATSGLLQRFSSANSGGVGKTTLRAGVRDGASTAEADNAAPNVIPLDRARSTTTNIRCHHCGGEWWRIIRRQGDGAVVTGAVILHATDHGDKVVGYSGYFESVECAATR